MADEGAYDVQVDYAFGRSDDETERLILQAEVLRPYTERLLHSVGVAPRMTVLDLGCGAGDVAFVAAGLVGDTGRVVGVDHDDQVLAIARERARAAGVTNVEFRVGAAESVGESEQFDVVTGRCVAFFAPDPAEFFRAAAGAVRPGGVLAVQEPFAPWVPSTGDAEHHGRLSTPRIEDIERVGEAFTRALRVAAPGHDVAPRMTEHFARAGLGVPRLTWDIIVGAGPDSPLYALAAASFRSMHPQLVRHGIHDFDDLAAIDDLADHLRRLAVARSSQVSFYSLVSAWVRR